MNPEPLKREVHADARGWLFEGVRDSIEGHIAQVYVTCCYPGIVKGWHRHALQTDRMICVSGMARIVTAWQDPEPSACSKYYRVTEHVIGPLAKEKVVVIPPGLWHAFTPAGNEPCVIVNAPDREFDGTDEERLELKEIPYEWRGVSR